MNIINHNTKQATTRQDMQMSLLAHSNLLPKYDAF